jgi:hypothetical protein
MGGLISVLQQLMLKMTRIAVRIRRYAAFNLRSADVNGSG